MVPVVVDLEPADVLCFGIVPAVGLGLDVVSAVRLCFAIVPSVDELVPGMLRPGDLLIPVAGATALGLLAPLDPPVVGPVELGVPADGVGSGLGGTVSVDVASVVDEDSGCSCIGLEELGLSRCASSVVAVSLGCAIVSSKE